MSGVVHIIKRDLMRVRTAAGPDAARANGRRGGDWPKSMTAAKLVLAKQMRRAEPRASYEVIAQALGLGDHRPQAPAGADPVIGQEAA